MPRRQALIEQLRELIADILGVEPSRIVAGSGPGTIDTWDSLAHLSIITAVEERFGVKFSMADVGNIASFETLAKLLAERQVR